MTARPFLLATTIDFPDDCLHIPFTPDLLTQLLDRFQWLGVQRVYYNYYALAGMWQIFAQSSPSIRQTLATLGDPMPLISRMVRERGMEFFAIIKPYETGMSNAVHPASPQAVANPGLPCLSGVYPEVEAWVKARPELRVRVRTGDLPAGIADLPITRIQLRQRDMTPIRIRPEHLEIWTSPDNRSYRKQELAFQVTEEVIHAPRAVVDIFGNPVTSLGDPIRVLNLTGLQLRDPFIAVTTNLADDTGTFRNTAVAMVQAFGPDDRPLPIVVGSHKAVWRRQRDFRSDDLAFDAGIGDAYVCLDVNNQQPLCPHCRERGIGDCTVSTLFPDTPLCRDGVIAFARGRNEYLSGSLCEGYPDVQAYWLGWISDCLAAGVDGVDVRISNHSSWTDTPELYGFNEPVRQEYARRYGRDPALERYDPELLGEVRGDLYDSFLRAAKQRLAAAGKQLHLHLEFESFRPDAPQARWRTRPGHIAFHWQRWLREGLPAEVQLMGAAWTPERALADPLVQTMLTAAAAHAIPAHLRRYMWWSRDGKAHADSLEQVYNQSNVAGYNLYETASFYDTQQLDAAGRLQFHPGMVEAIRARLEQLGLC
ncbi:MAG: hypothetical protein KF832_00840 [Caldilineaceae bacterium]|nr:hypothetical protein [Caldilineaceae bacterium]